MDPLEQTLTFPLLRVYAITSSRWSCRARARFPSDGRIDSADHVWPRYGADHPGPTGDIGASLAERRAKPYRKLTGDRRYRSEINMQNIALFSRITNACIHQIALTVHEPIFLFIAPYMTSYPTCYSRSSTDARTSSKKSTE
ncbi:hypothetical protein BDW66DRAFT_104550 [Aspergillus desertorum]